MSRSAWARGACLVLLVLFVLICGVHLTGILHDSDPGGLGLVDGLSAIVLVGVLALLLLAADRLRRPADLGLRVSPGRAPRSVLSARCSIPPAVPLRC